MTAEIKFESFAGIDNQTAADALTRAYLVRAVNIDIDDAKRIRRRGGCAQIDPSPTHSLFAADGFVYCRQGPDLLTLDPVSLDRAVVDTGLAGETAYVSVAGTLFYSDGEIARCHKPGEVAMNWGIVPPLGAPVLQHANAPGGLAPGRYLATVSFYRRDGEESGAPTPAAIEIPGGAIAFANLPVSADPDVTMKALYLSRAGGERLYFAMMLANTETDAVYAGSGADFGYELDGLHKTPPLPGLVLGAWNGRLLVGRSSALMYSDPFRLQRFDPIRQSIPFDSPLTILVDLTPDALVVGTESAIYRLEGADIESARIVKLADFGAIRAAVTLADGALIGDGTLGRVAVLATRSGIRLVAGAGQLIDITKKRYALPGDLLAGAAVTRERPGLHQAIFSLR